MRSPLVLLFCIVVALASDERIEKFTTSSKLFTGAVYNELLVDNTDNILVSPFSVETIFALTQSGAFGTTAQEIRSSFFLPDTEEETEAEMKSVLPTIHSDLYALKTANKIYFENNLIVKENFKKVATEVYQAALANVEFAQNVEAAEEINEWVREQTANKIEELVSPDDIDGSTVAVLVNALYFQANFSNPFNPPLTTKTSFFLSESEVVEVDTMVLESAELNFYESKELDAKIVELPFLDPDASLTIVLPNKKEGIAVLEKQTAAVLGVPEYRKEFVHVTLPKFRIESSIDFIPILKKLGVHAAFSLGTADFSGMAGEPGEMAISIVKQKTFIDVSEVGVEAAAATSVVIDKSEPEDPTQVFNADHPFFFYIKAKDIILFEGRVLSPKY